jgi:putative DNA primase/helicase
VITLPVDLTSERFEVFVSEARHQLDAGADSRDLHERLEKKLQSEIGAWYGQANRIIEAAQAMPVEALCKNGHATKEVMQAASVVEQQPMAAAQFIDPLPEVPAFLKAIPNWIRWKIETGDNGKPTKVPYRLDGRKAASTRSEDWSDYRAAVTGARIDNTQGVGFVVNGGIVGFDLDGCHDPRTGDISPWAQSIVDALDSYTEVTPSQTGVRVWVRGELPGTDKVFNLDPAVGFGDKVKIEVFTDGRYFTVTGKPLYEDSVDVEARDLTEVYQLCRDIRSQYPAPTKPKSSGTSITQSDRQSTPVVQTGFFNHGKLSVLMSGVIKSTEPFVIEDAHGNSLTYPSHSEADMALATVLAIEHGNDPEKISAEFRKSPLYRREKWDRLEQQTIEKAIKSAEETKAKSGQQSSIVVPTQASPSLSDAPSVTASMSDDSAIPDFDDSVITGVYKKIVDLICDGTTIPRQYVFLAAKVFLGARKANAMRFENIEDNSCYYGAVIGPTGTGKGLSWKRLMNRLFKVTGVLECGVKVIDSADSGAGLKDVFFEKPEHQPVICYIDEVTSLGHKGGDKKQPEIVDTIIELANSTTLSRTLAKTKYRTTDHAHLSLFMCGQDGEVFMSSFAGRTKLGLYDRFYPEHSYPVEAGDLPEVTQADAFKLLAEINQLPFSGLMTMLPETKQKLSNYWKVQPPEVKSKPRFKTYLMLDMFDAAWSQGRMIAEPQDLDAAIRIFERQLVIRQVHFTEEAPDKVGAYLGKFKKITESMRRRLNAGEDISLVAKSLRDFQNETHAYRNNDLQTFNFAWNNWKAQMLPVKVKATNGHAYDKFVPEPNENETWLAPPQ